MWSLWLEPSFSNLEDAARVVVYASPRDGEESKITRLDLFMKASHSLLVQAGVCAAHQSAWEIRLDKDQLFQYHLPGSGMIPRSRCSC